VLAHAEGLAFCAPAGLWEYPVVLSEVGIKTLKQNNARGILELMRQADVISVAAVSERIGLSKTTVKKIIDLLCSMNLACSAGKGLSTEEGGKKPELFRFNKSFGFVVSVHITPDAILAATTDLCGDITRLEKSEVSSERSLPLIIERLSQTIKGLAEPKMRTGEKLVGIVVALPGLADSSKGISIFSPHYPSWGRNVPFVDMLRQALSGRLDAPLFIDCVNRYQAIAEREKGVAAGVSNFMIIDALTEGLGAGIVLHGELLRGSQSLSGEIGHMTLNPIDGPPCICGKNGCFEAMVSAKRIRRMALDAYARGEQSVLFKDGEPEHVSLETVCEGARQEDRVCTHLIDDVAHWFAIGLGNIIMVNDPELVVIQGQYVKAGECFLARVRNGMKQIGLPEVEKRVRIEYSRLGEERGVIGGAAFVLDDYFANRVKFHLPRS